MELPTTAHSRFSRMRLAWPHLCLLIVFLLCVTLGRCASQANAEEATAPPPSAAGQIGIASWYGYHHNGRRTANGEIHNSRLLTAAHRGLPFGTVVRVTNLKSGSQVVVRINDRGPYVGDRVIDLSEKAARRLGMLDDGIAPVSIEIVTPPG